MLFNLRPKKQRESGGGSYIYIWYFKKTTPKMLTERSMAVSLLEETHSYGFGQLAHVHPIDMNEQAQL